MIKRKGSCRRCGSCCRYFIILAGAISSFLKACEKYGLRLILNKDGKTFRCNMLNEKTNLCKIYRNRPSACRNAPVKTNPEKWNCGYEFVLVNNKKRALAETKKAINYFHNLPKEMEGDPDN